MKRQELINEAEQLLLRVRRFSKHLEGENLMIEKGKIEVVWELVHSVKKQLEMDKALMAQDYGDPCRNN